VEAKQQRTSWKSTFFAFCHPTLFKGRIIISQRSFCGNHLPLSEDHRMIGTKIKSLEMTSEGH
jgi:hypothetical protein